MMATNQLFSQLTMLIKNLVGACIASVFCTMPAIAGNTSEFVAFPGYGSVKVAVMGDNEKNPLHLVLQNTKGMQILAIPFDPWGERPWPSDDLRFKLITIVGTNMPLIAAVALDPGGSDGRFESTLIGVVDGKPQDLLRPHPRVNYEGTVCLTSTGGDKHPDVMAINFMWEDGAHFNPHRYEITLFSWNGKRYVQTIHKKTKRKYLDWADAAKEYGYSCQSDFVSELYPNSR
jgi:hypothetical protein